jgi:hypothetical protein
MERAEIHVEMGPKVTLNMIAKGKIFVPARN